MILSFVTIYPRIGEEDKVFDLLSSMHGLIAANPQCMGCNVFLERGEQNGICYVEQWCNRESFEHHLRSPDYSRVLEAMELSCRPPEVEFFQGKKLGGLEFIGIVRLSEKGIHDQDPLSNVPSKKRR